MNIHNFCTKYEYTAIIGIINIELILEDISKFIPIKIPKFKKIHEEIINIKYLNIYDLLKTFFLLNKILLYKKKPNIALKNIKILVEKITGVKSKNKRI